MRQNKMTEVLKALADADGIAQVCAIASSTKMHRHYKMKDADLIDLAQQAFPTCNFAHLRSQKSKPATMELIEQIGFTLLMQKRPSTEVLYRQLACKRTSARLAVIASNLPDKDIHPALIQLLQTEFRIEPKKGLTDGTAALVDRIRKRSRDQVEDERDDATTKKAREDHWSAADLFTALKHMVAASQTVAKAKRKTRLIDPISLLNEFCQTYFSGTNERNQNNPLRIAILEGAFIVLAQAMKVDWTQIAQMLKMNNKTPKTSARVQLAHLCYELVTKLDLHRLRHLTVLDNAVFNQMKRGRAKAIRHYVRKEMSEDDKKWWSETGGPRMLQVREANGDGPILYVDPEWLVGK